ncbi:MAG: hypothetical protein AVDCRST_MAG69-851, partial [uncultured Solirubrobacteraceae bacterium]
GRDPLPVDGHRRTRPLARAAMAGPRPALHAPGSGVRRRADSAGASFPAGRQRPGGTPARRRRAGHGVRRDAVGAGGDPAPRPAGRAPRGGRRAEPRAFAAAARGPAADPHRRRERDRRPVAGSGQPARDRSRLRRADVRPRRDPPRRGAGALPGAVHRAGPAL